MMFKFLSLLSILSVACVRADHTNLRHLSTYSSTTSSSEEREITITVRNLAYSQPMSPFFVVVHNRKAPTLFKVGKKASKALAALAEDADTSGLMAMFDTDDVAMMKVVKNDQEGEFPKLLLEDGEYTKFTVTVSRDYPYVSMASMAVNTNDCFVGINAKKLMPGMELVTPGYDAGSELNNEDCAFIPGPAW